MFRVISRKGNFKWHLVFGYANMALAMTFGVFMVPLYLKYIPSNIFGAWLASGNILVWLVAINPGISTVIQQQVGNLLGQKNIRELSHTISSGLLIAFIISVCAAGLGLIFSDQAIDFLRLKPNVDAVLMERAFTAAAISVGILLFSDGVTSIIHGLHSSYYVGLTSMISYLAAIGSTILFLKEGYGVLAIPYGSITRGVCLVSFNLAYLMVKLKIEQIRFTFYLENLKKILSLFSYSFLGRLGGIITANSESVIIARYFAVDSVTPIILTKRLPQVFQGAILMVAQALFPSIAHLKGESNSKSIQDVLINVCSLVFWLLGFVITFFLLFNEKIVGLWIGSDLYAGNYFNLIICGSVFVSVVSHFFAEISAALGQIKKSGLAMVIQSVLFIPVVWMSINLFGLAGVIIGPAITMAAVSGWYYFYLLYESGSLNGPNMRSISKEISITISISVLLFALFYFMKSSTMIELTGVIFAFSGSYLVLLFFMSNRFKSEVISKLLSFKMGYNK